MQNYVEQIVPTGLVPHAKELTQKVGIIIPTYNAARYLPALINSFTMAGVDSAQVLIIDSSSTDETRDIAREAGFQVVCIPKWDFNHGGTRQLAAKSMSTYEYLVFCTQDVVLKDAQAIPALCVALDDASVGAAYGRQLPRLRAGAIERHARLFSYPEISQLRSFEDRLTMGIKATSMSNSFAIYRRSALEAVGGFPEDVLIAEDTIVAAKMLAAGWKVAYTAKAAVIHSHPVNLGFQFRRYFDIGVQHARSQWMMETFGLPYSEGASFLKSELRYLLANAPLQIPLALVNTATKIIAYRAGLIERHLPLKLKQKLSGYPHFWSDKS